MPYHNPKYGGGSGDRSPGVRLPGERKVRTPEGRALGNAQAERSDMSATENKPPREASSTVDGFHGVRVKRWGKSPPRSWRHGRQGKHRPEQDQIGERFKQPDRRLRCQPPREAGPVMFGKGWPDQGSRVGCWKRTVTCAVETWSPPCCAVNVEQNPAYRLAPCLFSYWAS